MVWTCSKVATAAKILTEAIAVRHEAEPRQEAPGAKPTLQNILQDYAAQVTVAPGRKTGMDLTEHGGQVQPRDRDIAFSLTSQMNYLQASSLLFLDSVPTSTWGMLEYNIQSSAEVNSEFGWISSSRRNCTSRKGLWMMSCKMEKTGLPPPHPKEWKWSCVMCLRAATMREHETRGQLNPTPQRSGRAQCQGRLG